MGCEVVWTASAADDLDHTIGYIAEALDSPRAAAELLDSIEEAVNRISEHPELYAVSRQPSLGARGLRACFVGNQVIVYGYDGQIATIHRILYARSDYGALVERERA